MENKNIITAMVLLQKSEAWLLVREEIMKTIQAIEQELFTVSDNDKKYSGQDLNRLLRQNLLDIIETPKRLERLNDEAGTTLA